MLREKTKILLKAWKNFYSLVLDEEKEIPPRFFFLYFSWIFFLVFLSFCFLSERNPFQLFLPFEVFEIPKSDPRKESIVFVSDGEQRIYPSKRLVFRKKEIKEDIRGLVEEVGRTPAVSDLGAGSGIQLKKLPNLGIALLSIWVPKGRDLIILDFHSSEVQREIAKFRFAKKLMLEDTERVEDTESYYGPPADFRDSKNQENLEEKKSAILKLTLQAIAETIRANYPEYKRVEYRLDGIRNTCGGIFRGFCETF